MRGRRDVSRKSIKWGFDKEMWSSYFRMMNPEISLLSVSFAFARFLLIPLWHPAVESSEPLHGLDGWLLLKDQADFPHPQIDLLTVDVEIKV